MRHTPGPWVIADQWIRAQKNGRGPMICQWGSYTGKANARLIAAAPDLLAALQRIAVGVESGESFSGTYCAEIARAAIAKATGSDK